MSVTVPTNSRLRFGELHILEGIEFWNILDLPDIPEQEDDITYMVVSSDRIDKLAYDFYGDPALWWVIAVANDMELLPTELNAGTQIRIPSQTYVFQSLFQNAKVQ